MSPITTVDVRGLSCPIPLVQVQNALLSNVPLVVISDCADSKRNIIRLLDKTDRSYRVEENQEDIFFHID